MNSLQFSSPLPLLTSPSNHCQHRLQLQKLCLTPVSTRPVLLPSSPSCLLSAHRPCKVACAPKEGTVAVMNIEELMEKDWSFLETEANHDKNLDRIISAGQIEPTSKVLVSLSSEGFVDRLVDTSEQQLLLVVHDSLFTLACIKEKYDKVKCWQGELIYVPEKWAPLDAAFIYFLPALPFTLSQIFDTLAKRCHPGARVVVSHPQGRQVLEEQRREFPDSVVGHLPDEVTLQKAAAEHCLSIVEYVDEPGLYLAVLKFQET